VLLTIRGPHLNVRGQSFGGLGQSQGWSDGGFWRSIGGFWRSDGASSPAVIMQIHMVVTMERDSGRRRFNVRVQQDCIMQYAGPVGKRLGLALGGV
jgi:hypothetical protein